MVYDKKKSGDPDYDDKVPAGEHGRIVTAGDGAAVGQVSESVGPVTPAGAHLDVRDQTGEDGDTRPAPGEVAKEKADVQVFTPEASPAEKVTLDQVAKEQDAGPEDESPVTETPGRAPAKKVAPSGR